MLKIHCIKNARNLKSIFDLRWFLVLLCIVELKNKYLNYLLKVSFQRNLLLVVENNPKHESNLGKKNKKI